MQGGSISKIFSIEVKWSHSKNSKTELGQIQHRIEKSTKLKILVAQHCTLKPISNI